MRKPRANSCIMTIVISGIRQVAIRSEKLRLVIKFEHKKCRNKVRHIKDRNKVRDKNESNKVLQRDRQTEVRSERRALRSYKQTDGQYRVTRTIGGVRTPGSD